MNEATIERIQRLLAMRETEDLEAIWEADDREEWSAEAFEAIRRILSERLGKPPERSRTAQARELLEEAEARHEADDTSGAMALCERAIALAPELAEAHNLQGVLYDDQGKTRQAAEAYRKALSLDSDFIEARENLDELLTELAEQDGDLDLEELNLDMPESPSATYGPVPEAMLKQAGTLVARASELEEAGDLEGAVAACEKALHLAPNLAEAHNMRGVLYDRSGEPGLAINEYHEAVRLNPRFRLAAANLSEALADWYEEFGEEGDAEVDLAAMYEALPAEEKEALAKDPRWGADIPGAFYLNESGVVLEGWSGNRLQPGNSGYDPLESDFETAQVQGILLRQLFTGTLRTRNPIYLAVMFFLGGMLVIPLVLTLATFFSGGSADLFLMLAFGVLSIPGFALIWNAYLSIVDIS